MNDNPKDKPALPLPLADAKRAQVPPAVPARPKSPAAPRLLLPAPRLPPRPNPSATKRAPVPQLALLLESPRVPPPANAAPSDAAKPNATTEPETAVVRVAAVPGKGTSP